MSTNTDVFKKNKYNPEFTEKFKEVRERITRIVTLKKDDIGLINNIPKDMMTNIVVGGRNMGRVYYIPTKYYLKIIKDNKKTDTSVNIKLEGKK